MVVSSSIWVKAGQGCHQATTPTKNDIIQCSKNRTVTTLRSCCQAAPHFNVNIATEFEANQFCNSALKNHFKSKNKCQVWWKCPNFLLFCLYNLFKFWEISRDWDLQGLRFRRWSSPRIRDTLRLSTVTRMIS